MSQDRILPELRSAAAANDRVDPSRAAFRLVTRIAIPLLRLPIASGVTVRRERRDGVALRIYEPSERCGRGALLWIHGGGLVIGAAKQDDPLCSGTSAELGIPVISAEYRLAPRHPFPAAHDDLRHAWAWVQRNASTIGIDPGEVAVGGESAGGGLAAALVQRIHDEGGTQPVAQWLFAPMLDDRTAADRSLDAIGHPIWDNAKNRFGWAAYLNTEPGSPAAPDYAVPARRADLAGLPPAFITTGSIELFHDEGTAYADRLRAAGVQVVTDVVEGAPHGFENWARESAAATALLGRARAWLGERLLPGNPDPTAEE